MKVAVPPLILPSPPRCTLPPLIVFIGGGRKGSCYLFIYWIEPAESGSRQGEGIDANRGMSKDLSFEFALSGIA